MCVRPTLAAVTAFAISIVFSPSFAEDQSAPPAKLVEIPVRPLPFVLKGFLRHPESSRRSPAVVLLPACGKDTKRLDDIWGARISSWGYVTLTIDGLDTRGEKNCGTVPDTDRSDLARDAYRALDFLVQKTFVDSKRTAVVGFALGAWQTLAAVERGDVQGRSEHKFRAAAAFYPLCGSFKGIMTVPTLILIGERDDWGTADACRKMVAGEDDVGISRQKHGDAEVQLIVYPDAYFGFDVPGLRKPVNLLGHHLEYNEPAARQSAEALEKFLNSAISSP
jgi:dienelactone hydrolase